MHFCRDRGSTLTGNSAFGNSLSFVTPAGNRVASESEPFTGTLDTSEYEIAVFSDKECDVDYGWTGSSKAFFIEFQMDHYQNRGTDQGLISDAPAWWFLNAAIPRILQYGNDRNNIPCSCWSTGCGEFDAFEVLGNGEERAKSTLRRQGNLEGGDSNYFKRPVGKTLKFAVVWHYPHITATVLNEDYVFPEVLTEDEIDSLVAYDPNSWVHSLFPVGD
ncbi:target of Sbf [Ascochyta clinopodiicola]|nr:target of Sbf [Ascochyta clinopodiicola]